MRYYRHTRPSIASIVIFGLVLTAAVNGHYQIPVLYDQAASQALSPLDISPIWNVLGPFQIGTREASWGSDPLERLGGFPKLHYNLEDIYKSSLVSNGSTYWTAVAVEPGQSEHDGVRIQLNIAFPEVDWSFQTAVYGWAALQYQAWARGYITVVGDATQTVELYTDGILEYSLDGENFFGGDVYSFRKAPSVHHLKPGSHQLDVRLVRDVRANGGVDDPVVQVVVELRIVTAPVTVVSDGLLLPDIVGNRLASTWASLTVRNTGMHALHVVDMWSADEEFAVSLDLDVPIKIFPGQTRPITFKIVCKVACSKLLAIWLEYEDRSRGESFKTMITRLLINRAENELQKVTFKHPSGVVSYFMLKPPTSSQERDVNCSCSYPVLITLHGAGVEAVSAQLTHSLDDVSELSAWTIFPTGGSPWSSDDWHSLGWGDVEAAIAYIPEWMLATKWAGPGVDLERWFVIGHSNGGQGVWYALTHRPDNLIAVAPVSGYLSIQKYVPYSFWHETDPRRMAVLFASLNSYRHELLISNAKGIPILQQHGSADDNVPAYHSRRMSELLDETGWQSTYVELSGKGHWFDGIMTTASLKKFYSKYLSNDLTEEQPQNFKLVIANPGDTGSKYGVRVWNLLDPGQLGYVKVAMGKDGTEVQTSNIETLSIPSKFFPNGSIKIDGQRLTVITSNAEPIHLASGDGRWTTKLAEASSLQRRSGRQNGHLDAVLKSRGTFVIVNHDRSIDAIALQISRNLHQYYGADTEITNTSAGIEKMDGNVFTIGLGGNISQGALEHHPIQLSSDNVCVRHALGKKRCYGAEQDEGGVGAIFLRPLPDERLELVVWGSDRKSVAAAARLVPMVTGVGQPDFVILTQKCSWAGLDGALAMGFFDAAWNVSGSSFLS